LGSVNVLKLLRPAHESDALKLAASDGRQTVRYEVDFDLLTRAVHAMVRAFDNVIERTVYPLPAQEQEAKAKRRMGIGVTGMANALEVMGLPYGTADFIAMQGEILRRVLEESYSESCRLAVEKGPFPLWDAEKYCAGEFFKKSLPETLQYRIEKHGLRNGLLTSIAPTGTISMAADNISSGIEPVFSHRAERVIKTPEGDRTFEVTDAAFNQFGVRGRTASEVPPEEHVAVLCAAQQWVDSSISKTINVTGQVGGEGPGTTYNQFKDLYLRAYRGGAKGCTTFNSTGKRMGILRPADIVDEPGTGAACVIDAATGARTCDV
jgi:ribonucleoside-diphosphate reductase alpha chain